MKINAAERHRLASNTYWNLRDQLGVSDRRTRAAEDAYWSARDAMDDGDADRSATSEP